MSREVRPEQKMRAASWGEHKESPADELQVEIRIAGPFKLPFQGLDMARIPVVSFGGPHH